LAATLQDIANATRTSVSTVSRVLAGGVVSSRISNITRQRVIEAASRLGYRPNLVARSLRTRRSNTIALLVSDIANPFFGQIGSLIEQALHRHGYSLMLCNSGEDPDRESEYLQMLRQKAIDGMIVVPLARSKRALTQHLPAGIPLVILDRPIPGISASVASDQDHAAGILCDTLERAGVRQVSIVAGPQHVVTHRRRKEIISARFKVVAYYEGPAQKETGRQAFIRFLTVGPKAIVCTNNFLAQGVIDSIAKIDQPPIIGVFDEIPMMHLLPLPIVCSMQDIPMLAETAASQLLAQLNGHADQCRPVLLPARAVTNQAFQARQFPA
jgi:LacI family transcriptional regulator